jgi:vitamin B12 transporter
MKHTLLGILCVLTTVTLHAVEQHDSLTVTLQDLQVQAMREKQFPGTTKVLYKYSSKEIRATPALSADAFLKNIPGVDIRQRSIGGTQADISIRGGSFDQVLVLLNGVNITDQQTGHHNLNIPVDLQDVDRIEVLMGSAARRYGNQAFSGAINIITNPSSQDMVKTSLTAGSFRTFTQKSSFSLGKKALKNFTSFSHAGSKGYRANTDYDSYQVFSHTTYTNQKIGNFDLQLGYQRKSFGAAGFYTLDYPNQFEHIRTQFSALHWQKTFAKLFLSADVHFRKHYDRFELFRNFKQAADWYVDHNYHLTDAKGGKFDLEYFAPYGKIAAGAALRYDHIYSTVLGSPLPNADVRRNRYEKRTKKYFDKEAERFVRTMYIDYAKAIHQFYVSTGTSVSRSRDFGLQHHWGADISYVPVHHLTLFAAANTASRLPTFTDLYYQSATQLANPNLKPEYSMTYDLGFKYDLEPWQFQGNIFHRTGKDIIDWVKYPDEEKWQSMNLTHLNTAGLSLFAQYLFQDSFLKDISLAYSFINTDKQAEEYDSKYALDYLRHQVVLKLHHQIFKNFKVAWNLNWSDRAGSYADFDTGDLKSYQPYLLADCRIAWEKRRFTIHADINNIFNQSYVDYGGLPMPGIYWNVGVKWGLK